MPKIAYNSNNTDNMLPFIPETNKQLKVEVIE
jgi:hypothetical protein